MNLLKRTHKVTGIQENRMLTVGDSKGGKEPAEPRKGRTL